MQRAPKQRVVNLMLGVPVSGSETLTVIQAPANSAMVSYKNPFNIASATSLLQKYATIYESYKIRSVSYRFVPDEGGMASGNVTMGIDYGKVPEDLTREQISKLNPHYSGPIRKTSPWITIAPQFVNTSTVRYTSDESLLSTPFSLVFIASCEAKTPARNLGAIQIKYSLEFQGILP